MNRLWERSLWPVLNEVVEVHSTEEEQTVLDRLVWRYGGDKKVRWWFGYIDKIPEYHLFRERPDIESPTHDVFKPDIIAIIKRI